MIFQGRMIRVSFGDNMVAELTKLAVPPSTFGLTARQADGGEQCKLYSVYDCMGERIVKEHGQPAFFQYGADVSGMWTNPDLWITPEEADAINAARRAAREARG